MNLRRTFAILLAVTTALGGSIYLRADALEQQRTEAAIAAMEATSRADAAQARADRLTESIALAEGERETLEALLEVRPAFVKEVESFSAALERAQGKVDTAPLRESVLSEQRRVLAERVDVAVVTTATERVRALTAQIGTRIAEWERAQAAAAAASRHRGAPTARYDRSGPDGYARVRAALNRVGGSGVGLYESSSCAGGRAPACANSNGYIKYRADVANWSSGRLHWAMAHELAHIYQFRVWRTMNASPSYASLFNRDPEFLANCMALVRGYPGSTGCNSTQRAWASGIWVGSVR